MTFEINPNFDRDLFRSEELTQLVYDGGDRVLTEAEGIAMAEGRTFDFATSLHKDDHRARSGRPISTVYSDDPGALSIEFGTRYTPAHRTLGRALESIRR